MGEISNNCIRPRPFHLCSPSTNEPQTSLRIAYCYFARKLTAAKRAIWRRALRIRDGTRQKDRRAPRSRRSEIRGWSWEQIRRSAQPMNGPKMRLTSQNGHRTSAYITSCPARIPYHYHLVNRFLFSRQHCVALAGGASEYHSNGPLIVLLRSPPGPSKCTELTSTSTITGDLLGLREFLTRRNLDGWVRVRRPGSVTWRLRTIAFPFLAPYGRSAQTDPTTRRSFRER